MLPWPGDCCSLTTNGRADLGLAARMLRTRSRAVSVVGESVSDGSESASLNAGRLSIASRFCWLGVPGRQLPHRGPVHARERRRHEGREIAPLVALGYNEVMITVLTE
jgi:hypothetical protein